MSSLKQLFLDYADVIMVAVVIIAFVILYGILYEVAIQHKEEERNIIEYINNLYLKGGA